MSELYGAFATAQFDYTTDVVEQITGQPPNTSDKWARGNAAAFQ